MAFELLTGALPFAGGNLAEQARHKLEDEPFAASSIAPELPPAVDSVLSRALSRDPRERWPSACKFVDELEQALGTPAVTEDPEDTVALPVPLSDSAEAPEPPSLRRGGWGCRRRLSLNGSTSAGRASTETPPPRLGRRVLAVVCSVAALGGIALQAALLSGGGDKELSLRDRREARREAAQTRRQERARRERSLLLVGAGAQGFTGPAISCYPGRRVARDPQRPRLRPHAEWASSRGRAGPGSALSPVIPREDTADLGYAYALSTWRASCASPGKPGRSHPYLEKRLKFANQRGVVNAELRRRPPRRRGAVALRLGRQRLAQHRGDPASDRRSAVAR